MFIIGSDIGMINATKRILSKQFDMKDMGVADVILGIKITRTSKGYTLSQAHYIEKIFKKFSKDDEHIVKIHVDMTVHLANNVGSLMYIMNCTRPNITYAMSKLNRYTSNPEVDH